MNGEWVRWAIEIVAALVFVRTGWALVRYYTTRFGEDGKPKAIGGWAFQNMLALSTLSAILILGLEHVIDGSVTGALLGAVTGYSLGSSMLG